tara:strand:- start:404 stop:622 length:219 start_codon:yes stop_codon:yes gene_type:complete
MEQIIDRLKQMKLSPENNPQTVPITTQIVPITNKQLSNICLQLYNENFVLKKQIQSLLISQTSSVTIPEWVK